MLSTHILRIAILFGMVLLTLRAAVAATTEQVATRAELVAALAAAEPGTEIRLAAGTYHGGMSQAKLAGTADAPIVIAAADPDYPPIIDGGGAGLQLDSPAYVVLSDLVFTGATGNGLNIDDSGDVAAPAHHVTIRNVTVRNVGPHGNCDGIKLSGVEDFHLIGCRVEQWGDGGSGVDMVGCHRGVIERSQFLGPGGEQANAVQTKGGSSDVAIRTCRIENPGGRGVNVGGSTGLPYFRPHDAAYEARNITVEDCVLLGGAAALAFVGVDGAIIRHNTIYRPRRWAIRILQETVGERFVSCRRVEFTDNIVAFRSDELREAANIGPHTEPQSFKFSANLWYCLDDPDNSPRLVRLPVEEANARYGPPPDFADAEHGDLRIRNRTNPSDPGAR